MAGSGGGIDPLVLPTATALPINFNTKAVALRTQTVNPAIKNGIFIVAGQSNITNLAPSTYSPTNASAIDNMNVFDGAIYAAADPLIGTSLNASLGNGHPILRLADNYITSGNFERIIIVPLALSATTIAVWDDGAFASGYIPAALARLTARGIVAGTNVTICILWGQGESDNGLTSQAAYTAALNRIIATSRAAGFTGRWFVARQTYAGGAASATIQAAQAACINHGAGVWEGANADLLVASVCGAGVSACRVGDNTHFTDAGAVSYAAQWKINMALSGAPF